METIPQELVTFKSTVEPNLESTMEPAVTKITDKVTETINANKSAKEGINTYYNSQNKQTVLSRFDKINDIYSKISSSVESDLKGIIDGAKVIISLVKELEEINKEIEEQEKKINLESGDTDESKKNISDAQDIINTKKSEFNTKKNDALQKLNQLKSMDASISFVEEFSGSDDYESKLEYLQGGRMVDGTFKASNGVVIEYHTYLPDYGAEEVEDLPINLYLPGSGEVGGRTFKVGLPQMLKNGTIKPSGIVVCPEIPTEQHFEDPAFQQALVELTGHIAEQHNGDVDRVSISGHSYGAIAGYEMIDRYPGYFSAFVPISGGSFEATKAMSDVKIWAFHGANDNGGHRTNYSLVKQLISQLQKMGGEASLYTFVGKGHNVQNLTFQHEYEDSDGEMINPIEWALRQKKDKK